MTKHILGLLSEKFIVIQMINKFLAFKPNVYLRVYKRSQLGRVFCPRNPVHTPWFSCMTGSIKSIDTLINII